MPGRLELDDPLKPRTAGPGRYGPAPWAFAFGHPDDCHRVRSSPRTRIRRALEIREIGGVLGIAVLAAVFANQGDYATSTSFVAGFTRALIGAPTVALGALAALLIPGRRSARAALESALAAA